MPCSILREFDGHGVGEIRYVIDIFCVNQIIIGIAAALLLLAALRDIASRNIPNWIAAALAVIGLLLRFSSGTLVASLMIAATVFIAAAICWRHGVMGGGDVKLLSAAALLVSPWLVPDLLLSITLAGGILAIIYISLRHLLPVPSPIRPRLLVPRVLRAEAYRITRSFSLPYASAIAAGSIFALTGI